MRLRYRRPYVACCYALDPGYATNKPDAPERRVKVYRHGESLVAAQ